MPKYVRRKKKGICTTAFDDMTEIKRGPRQTPLFTSATDEAHKILIQTVTTIPKYVSQFSGILCIENVDLLWIISGVNNFDACEQGTSFTSSIAYPKAHGHLCHRLACPTTCERARSRKPWSVRPISCALALSSWAILWCGNPHACVTCF